MHSGRRSLVLRLRPGVRVVRIGANAIWFLGALRSHLFSGPKVQEHMLPLLEALRRDEISGGFSRDATYPGCQEIASFIETLDTSGLLALAEPGSKADLSDAHLFVSRVSGSASRCEIANENPNLVTDVGVFLDCEASWRPELAAALRAASIELIEQQPSLGDHARQQVAQLEIVRDGRCYKLALEREELGSPYRLSVHTLDNQLINTSGPTITAALQFSIIAHWLIAASAGLQTARSLIADLRALFAPDNTPALPTQRRQLSSDCRTNGGAGNHALLLEVCRYSAGTNVNANQIRRISPSAGDLGSVHALALIKTPGSGRFDILYYSAPEHLLSKLGDIAESQLGQCKMLLSHEAWLILVSTMRPLKRRYGPRACALADFDGGASMLIASVVAQAHGQQIGTLSHIDRSALAQLLRFASTGDSFRIVGIGAIKASPRFNGARQPDLLANPADRRLADILNRRSCRCFANQGPSLEELEAHEEAFFRTYWQTFQASTARPDLKLFRLRRAGNRSISCTELGEGGDLSEMTLGGLTLESVVRQRDLGNATAVYIVGMDGPGFTSEHRNRNVAGQLLTAIWLSAGSHRLAGTLCGDVDMTSIAEREPGRSFQPLALCLGACCASTSCSESG